MTKQDKVCVECKKDLARYWGKNFCRICLGELLNAQRREDEGFIEQRRQGLL